MVSLAPRKKKLTIIFGVLIALLIFIRALAPSIILNKINATLATFSPLYSLHIRNLDLQIWRMAYSFDDVEGTLKKEGSRFLAVQKISVALAWRELIRGRIVADVDARVIDLKITTETLNALSGHGVKKIQAEAKTAKQATIPFDLERLHATESRFEFSDLADIPPEQAFILTKIDLLGNNLTPVDPRGLSLITFSGAIQDTAKIKGVAQLRPKATPAAWSVNIELRDFDLRKINPIASRMVPISFKTGILTLFSAAQSVDGKLRGYIKPFLKDIVFIGDRDDFKTVGHFFYEIAGTIGNFFLKNHKTHVLATKVNFHTEGGKTVMDTGKAINLAIKNGLGKPLSQGLDESLELE